MIIDSKEKVFQQRKPLLPPSLGVEATYFLTVTLHGTLSMLSLPPVGHDLGFRSSRLNGDVRDSQSL